MMVKRKRRYRRGYPVALLIGFENDHVVLWRIFSRVVKLSRRLEFEGGWAESQALYKFHETIIGALKPVLNEGVRTVVVAAPVRTTYASNFLEHVQKHHRYLIQSKNPNRANFVVLVGSVDDHIKVAEMVKTKIFTELIAETTSEEADHVINRLEKHLYGTTNSSVVLYTLKEIEDTIYSDQKCREFRMEYLLLSNKYLTDSKQKNRIHRLLQIAKNNNVKTNVVKEGTPAGNRINQFGGIVFFSELRMQRNV